jgi:hypothetical protein
MPDLARMTSQHMLYIPAVLLVGLVTGYLLGARAMRAELERRKRRMKE